MHMASYIVHIIREKTRGEGERERDVMYILYILYHGTAKGYRDEAEDEE